MTSCNGDRTKLAVLRVISIAPLRRLVTQLQGVAPCASSRDCATARRGRGRRATGRGSSLGSRVCRASELGSQPCWRVCRGEPRSSVGDGGYTGRGERTSGSTCTCGGIPGSCVPSCRGHIIGLSGGASYSMGPIERPVVLDLNDNPSDPPCADCRRSHR